MPLPWPPAVKCESRKPDEELADEAISRHTRNLCSQFPYIAQERVDLLWLTKEDAKTMTNPSVKDLTRWKRSSVPEGDAGLRVHAGTTT